MRIRVLRPILSVVGVILGSAILLAAQAPVPRIVRVPYRKIPKVPPLLQPFCSASPSNVIYRSETCPIIQYGTWTTWALSPLDDKDVRLHLVTFDEHGTIVRSVSALGVHYAKEMWVEAGNKTVRINGHTKPGASRTGVADILVTWTSLGPGPDPGPQNVYRWVKDTKPAQGRLITAPDSNQAVCRGQGPQGPIAGSWNGSQCLTTFAGNDFMAKPPYEFLSVILGDPQWFTGMQKKSPGLIGLVPFNSINASTRRGDEMVLCSQAGLIGYVRNDRCRVYGPARGGNQNATVLIGFLFGAVGTSGKDDSGKK